MRILIIIDMQRGTVEGTYHKSSLKSDAKWMAKYKQITDNILYMCPKFEQVIMIVDQRFKRVDRKDIISPLRGIVKNSIQLSKKEDDGSSEISKYVSDKDELFLVGMNTDACVERTAYSLFKTNIVSVIRDGCWSVYAASKNTFNRPFGEAHYKSISRLKKKGIQILSMKDLNEIYK